MSRPMAHYEASLAWVLTVVLSSPSRPRLLYGDVPLERTGYSVYSSISTMAARRDNGLISYPSKANGNLRHLTRVACLRAQSPAPMTDWRVSPLHLSTFMGSNDLLSRAIQVLGEIHLLSLVGHLRPSKWSFPKIGCRIDQQEASNVSCQLPELEA